MKTRTGFVSNSSSSSFILYGVYSPDREKLAQASWDHIGDEKLIADGFETVDDFIEAVNDDMYVLEGYDLPIEVMYYDEYYAGISLNITRNTLLHGDYTKEQLDEIDAFLAKCSSRTPSVHEGDYYN